VQHEDELSRQLTACRREEELKQQLAQNTARVRQSNQELKEFAYMASHDFR